MARRKSSVTTPVPAAVQTSFVPDEPAEAAAPPAPVTKCPECGSPLVNCISGAICPSCGKGGLHPLLPKKTDRANRRAIEAGKMPSAFIFAVAFVVPEFIDRRCYGVSGNPGVWRRVKRDGARAPARNGNILAAIRLKGEARIIELAQDTALMGRLGWPKSNGDVRKDAVPPDTDFAPSVSSPDGGENLDLDMGIQHLE